MTELNSIEDQGQQHTRRGGKWALFTIALLVAFVMGMAVGGVMNPTPYCKAPSHNKGQFTGGVDNRQ